MREFAFELATPADDAAILRLLRDNPVPGSVTISYERAPSYFLGCEVLGDGCQTLVARHLPSGAVAAMACRALRRRFINGRPETVGYLGQLRVDHRFRARWLVAGGFRCLWELHQDRRAQGYLTTIIEGNREAEGVLVTRARRHFPRYRPLERLHTLALHSRDTGQPASAGCEIRRGDDIDLEDLVAFLNRQGSLRQFFPVLTVADFGVESGLLRGLGRQDLLIALRRGRLVGILGLWEQGGFKQSVVRGYQGLLRWGRPLYNGYNRLRGLLPLPPPGAVIPMGYAALHCIAENDAAVFDLLLRRQLRTARERQLAFLMAGFSAGDPLLGVARRYSHIDYVSRLYTVGWDNGSTFHDRLDGRNSQVEIATL